ncbi:inversin-like [Haliotis rubra]|uniref:inversin-like n=1 Tax=Haliotis rubra TaxID=36100 RepID=UPI001EE50514|nr:inversin-like [Haliotis rubra]
MVREKGHQEIVELLVKNKANLLLSDKHGDNTRHCACNGGHFDVVKYVLSLNSEDINSSGREGRTPVMIAAEKGHKEVVELLVRHGANLLLSDKHGDNTLHRTCNGGHFDVVKYVLCLNSVDINSTGWKKRTPVMIAADYGHKEVVELMVKNEANFSLRDEDGKSILDFARQGGYLEVVQYVMTLLNH